ncbi:MAG: AI-2E family transporter [Thermoanaerobaculia bacterium]
MQAGQIPPPAAAQRPIVLIVFGGFALLIVWAVAKVLAPFITPILLAAIVTTFTYPVFRRARGRLGGREPLAAGVMLLVVTLTIVMPAFVLVILLVDQAATLFELLQRTDFQAILARMQVDQRLATLQQRFPGLDVSRLSPQETVLPIIKQIPGFVAAHGGAFLAGAATLVVQFVLMLLAMYFFYVDGPTLVRKLKYLSPLPDEYEHAIVEKFKGVVNATFRGQVLTAVAQGVVTGIGLAIAGVPGAFFWGSIASVFALIPMVGAAAVWVPAAIYLFFAATYADAGMWRPIFMVAWGAVPVSLVDNVIRPWAMKAGTNMPAVVLLFSILGGIQAFGFVGLILGPLVFALLMVVVEIYEDFFGGSLASPPAVVTSTPAATEPPSTEK